MCGIVGFKSHKRYIELKNSLPDSADLLSHRGPDDSGIYFDEKNGIGLAHRRLSIIDLSTAGVQPMASEDGTVHIVYNGEVYNYLQLRKTLEKKGHIFRSSTDTEVVLKAYLEWGVECLEKFIGMFALSIWDRPKKQFFLARDRLGIKPLYYYYKDQTFIFGSELKALMAFKCFEKTIDDEALPLFLHYQYIPAPKTIFKHTYKLPPGNFLLFDGQTISLKPYWNIPTSDAPNRYSSTATKENNYLEQLDSLLTEAVTNRLISDVPLGALLSGGIDSSVITALMQKVSPQPIRTFSIGFMEKGFNEAPWAKQVANHLGTDHTELYVTPKQAMCVIPRLPEIYDEPFADPSAIPTFLVSKLTRSQVTVALSGDGGDEQFSGYVRYWMTQNMALWSRKLPIIVKKVLAQAFKLLSAQWIEKCYLPIRNRLPQRFQVANFQEKWQKLLSILDQTQVSELYRMTICLWPNADLFRLIGRTLPQSNYETIFNETRDWPVLSQLMRVDQGTYLPDCMLTKVDRASMATGLEIRVPLLDHRVVEFTAKLPNDLKFRNGEGKYLLKKLLSRYVPTELFQRPKMGFGVPIDHWLRGELKDLLLDYLSPERLKKEGLFDHVIVENKIKEHLSGRFNRQYQLWALLMWEMWKERWLDR
ncbi:MAG: asparagine synthase (glutamine-hydrolyzing) [Proteobacteria bacterium]|nr:asparagine synthase (glutamine-hydrolyzing) [Pseudomonadota bacterium]